MTVVGQSEIVVKRSWVEHAFRRAVEIPLNVAASAAEVRGRFTSGAKARIELGLNIHASRACPELAERCVLHPTRGLARELQATPLPG
jgi:hypothetical protein